MTGSPDCVELVQVLSSYLGEELEIARLERKNPLKALRHAVELDGKIDPGTAIIAFTRRDVLGIRDVLEQRRVAASVIYGALSPEVRRNSTDRGAARQVRVAGSGVCRVCAWVQYRACMGDASPVAWLSAQKVWRTPCRRASGGYPGVVY